MKRRQRLDRRRPPKAATLGRGRNI
ncbi:uncharacterized protein G2W53_000497 [Senna tora]|uniref:Uncharacterized protein n=1 Tax=Senna tora TaxID=362788 RepID=A0A834XG01_9FABA|nr:uncharacterized protein G2W53_000497 [Senna tora]